MIGLVVIFPICFIVQGVLCAGSKKMLGLGIIISSLAVLLPIEIFYNIAGVLEGCIFYILIGIFSYSIKTKMNKGQLKRGQLS